MLKHQAVLETGKSKIKALADSVPGENLLSDSWLVVSLLCPHVVEEARVLWGLI